MNYIDQIASLGACPEALDWLHEFNHPTLQEAWAACPRADWMFWLLRKAIQKGHSIDPRALVLCACDIAETVLIHIPAGEDRPRTAIETIRRWLIGEATAEEVRSAHRAALDFARATPLASFRTASAAAANAAAHVVTIAVESAEAVAYVSAAVAVANAAAYATSAAVAVAYADADAAFEAADIVRRYFPYPPKLPGVSR